MSRLTRDRTAEPVSRDQILRHARGQGNIIFPVQLTTSRIGNLTRLIHTLLYVMTVHTYIVIMLYDVIEQCHNALSSVVHKNVLILQEWQNNVTLPFYNPTIGDFIFCVIYDM